MERYVVHTTKLCNMDCTYCYEHDKISQYTWDEIEHVLKGIVENSPDKKCSIEFLGGEPMIAFHHIKDTVAYMESQEGFTVDHYVITTNGTFISDDIIAWLKENPKVYLSISIDGGRVANMLRIYKTTEKATLEDVERNTKQYLAEFGTQRVWAHMVTHPWNVYLVKKSVEYIYNIGIRVISVGIIEYENAMTQEYANRLVQELDKVSREIIKGKMTDLYIDMLHEKPERRSGKVYIKDKETGKVLAESYGSVENDITYHDTEAYESIRTSSPDHETIQQLKEQIYVNNQSRLRGD